LPAVTDVVIRPVTPEDDFEAQVDLGQRAFGLYSPAQKASWLYAARLRASQGLFLGAFTGGQPAGAAMIHDMRQWWAGRAVPCAGVASVKVAPEHRGQGIGRRLMTELLEVIAARGYPLSALFPATMPLYRSLGWELAGGRYDAIVPARSLRRLLPPDADAPDARDAAGTPGAGSGHSVRRAGPEDAAAVVGVIGRCHEAARDSGGLTWDEPLAARWLSREDLYAYLTGDGFAAYRWTDANKTLLVERVQATSPGSLRALWSVIASHGSTVAKIRACVAPGDPFWWLTHERDAAIAKRSLWMLRVVDAPAAIAARGFPPAVTLSVPLVVEDRARPANSGHWQLSVSDGKGIIIPNGPVSSPDPRSSALRLGARGLAALYAGTPVSTLRLAGLAAGGTSDAAALDAAFAASPYVLDSF
jgi:predicted acetyltransferase